MNHVQGDPVRRKRKKWNEGHFENSKMLLNAFAVLQVELYWQILWSATTMTDLESESSSVGRASAFQAEGRRFETGLSLQDSNLPFLISSSGVEQSGSSSGS